MGSIKLSSQPMKKLREEKKRGMELHKHQSIPVIDKIVSTDASGMHLPI